MENNQDVFRFELNESLFFEKGQEVGEMMGVSLDPEISIQSFNDYISIRGVIELQGTYQKEPLAAEEEEEDTTDLQEHHSRRYIENVEDLSDGQIKFSHRFPVEISVPANRVSDLDEVTVGIESFDYEIPDKNRLKLNASVEIHGISDRAETTDGTEQDQNQSLLPREDETFEFDVKMPTDDTETEATNDLETVPELPEELPQENHQESTPESEEGTEQIENDDSVTEKKRWKGKKSQTLAEFFGTKEKESHDSEVEELETEEQEWYESDEDTGYVQEEETQDESISLVEASETGDLSESATESSGSEDVRYLADMFRSDEEEQYAKMRLCIVQETDTVESIAERYGISALQLLKQNHLGEDSLEEGQLLYIPSK
ncbi:stage VI sporulation protein D [Lentibacillus cibarius]|uniref:Stage VI sporulation protein D n=1 Tax=Lentibacillus cibarius TaxID=2583219 RepID=A0A549YLS8_9BACI|nr:stage VI sporulation protein D [Lentibacillus cibarius]TRM12842.1 stage VI sporulation protein D [Lentibacillus cibarius]